MGVAGESIVECVISKSPPLDGFLGGTYSTICSVTRTSEVEPIVIFSGESENEIVMSRGVLGGKWGTDVLGTKSIDSADSITSLAISIDLSFIVCAIEQGPEARIFLFSAPLSSGSFISLNDYSAKCIVDGLDFPVRSLSIDTGASAQSAVFYGTDEGKIEFYSISLNKRTCIFSDSSNGGVKCITTTSNGNVILIAASFCAGNIIVLDSLGRILSRLGSDSATLFRPTTPGSLEKCLVRWSPQKDHFLFGGAKQVRKVRRNNLSEIVTSNSLVPPSSGIISVVEFSVDGRFFATLCSLGSFILLWDSLGLSIRACISVSPESSLVPIVTLAWQYSEKKGSHSLLLISRHGAKPVIDQNTFPSLAPLLSSPLLTSSTTAPPPPILLSRSAPSELDKKSDSSRIVEVESKQDDRDDHMEVGNEEADHSNHSMNAIKSADKNQSVKSKTRTGFTSFQKQPTFQPGETSEISSVGVTGGKRTKKLLCWNAFGHIIKTEFHISAISGFSGNPRFADEAAAMAAVNESVFEVVLNIPQVSMREFRLKDSTHGWSLASLGSKGITLAVKSRIDLSNTYEEEDEDDEDREDGEKTEKIKQIGGVSKLSFRPFQSWGPHREWLVALPRGEEAECICAGNLSVACMTSSRLLRLFSINGGMILNVVSVAGFPVSLCCNGNFLFSLVTPDGTANSTTYSVYTTDPVSGCLHSVVSAGLVPASSCSSIISWVSLSDEFLPVVSDSDGKVFALLPLSSNSLSEFCWVPILRLVEDCQKNNEGYWPISVSSGRVYCAVTRHDDGFEPRLNPLPRVASFPLNIPCTYLPSASAPPPPEASFLLARLHSSFTASTMGLETHGGEEFMKSQQALDKQLAILFRQFCEAGQIEKAFDLSALVINPSVVRVLLKICSALGLRSLETKIDSERLQNRGGTMDISRDITTTTVKTPSTGSSIKQPHVAEEEPVAKTSEQIQKSSFSNPFAKHTGKRHASENDGASENKITRT